MILGFKTEINGKPTGFTEKILKHLGKEAVVEYVTKQPSWIRFALTVSIAEATPKKLTLRDDPNNRLQPGRKIHFATGVRTKHYECFAEGECKHVGEIFFEWIGKNNRGIRFLCPGDTEECNYIFWSDGNPISLVNATQIAFDDGFESLQSFFDFHYTENMKRGNGRWSFKRKIIYF